MHGGIEIYMTNNICTERVHIIKLHNNRIQ